ncbi:hypothetical protein FF38_06765 [Lucilia cuprina]|uniref:HTH CENPB-type domain-containing protein n=1 Tax=Lucilia cuprina TaxID=7375 RepID=A0A0L0CR50_LUCCU|nr:hypothetical protein CVS40_3857 [Lucilia cuprina]KNC34823.1 hypothetical protein FF38_06765 [Lucilia cuprina]
MAQDLDFDHYIDVDNTTVKPSPQRVRNILTLEEKVAVIHAYDQRPMYKKVARMFNCSWEQIKNIISNRTAIMEYYNETKNKEVFDADYEQQMDVKQRKIKFLGECVYECLQRLQYYTKLPITEELIRNKALEFLDVLRIPGFTPTKKWMNLFKASYNITLSNKQISIYTKPQYSLDIKDIVTYCTKAKVGNKCLLTKCRTDDVKNVEYESKRLRKLNFLQEALKEYMLRVKFHHKSMKLDTDSLRLVAKDFNEILKVQDFEPTVEWINEFRTQHDIERQDLSNIKRPPLSLDLKDILSYCSRMQNKAKDTVTLAPKETALQMRVLPKFPGKSINESGLKFQKNSIIYLDEEAALGEKDIKPDIEEIRVERPQLEQPPPLKIRKIESINNDPELQRKFQTNIEIRKVSPLCVREMPKEPPKSPSKTVIYIQKVPAANVPKENVVRLTPQPPAPVQIKEEMPDDNSYILPTNTVITPPQLRIQKVQQQFSPSSISPTLPLQQHQSLPHKADDFEGEDLPRHVTSFKDVLLLLKPLEEYAMLKENYRAIGLITQLEEVLKNPPEDHNVGDEEFIG